jgi:Ca2+-binding RTX toxin-like protein
MRHRSGRSAAARSLGIAAVCLLVLLPAESLAATANTRIKRVFYTAGTGELNDLTVSLSGVDYLLSDPGATIAAAPACTGMGTTATCAGAGIIGLTVSGGDGADSLTNTTATRSTLSGGDGNDSVQGGSGNDILRGNQGVDTQAGGAGDDLIDVRGDRGDVVSCGDGNDTVRADTADSLAPDCEIVDRGVVVAPVPPPGPSSPPSPTAKALVGPAEARTFRPGACARDLLGSPEGDRLTGTPLGDSIFGLQGDDALRGGRGDDCMFGGTGSDRLAGSAGRDRLLGDDSRRGVGGDDRLAGNSGNDLLTGGPGNDRLSAGGGHNRLYGGLGNDRLKAVNHQRDRLSCGRGLDSVRADRIDRVFGCERVHRRR